MDEFNKYSGIIALVTSLITVAYMFGSISSRIGTLEKEIMSEQTIVHIMQEVAKKEREISDIKYYVKPEVSVQYLSKAEFQQYKDLAEQMQKNYQMMWESKYGKIEKKK